MDRPGHQLTKIAEQQRALVDWEAKVKAQQVRIDLLSNQIQRMKVVMDEWVSRSDGFKWGSAANDSSTIDPFAPLPPRSPEAAKK